jgi:hypothetical protein
MKFCLILQKYDVFVHDKKRKRQGSRQGMMRIIALFSDVGFNKQKKELEGLQTMPRGRMFVRARRRVHSRVPWEKKKNQCLAWNLQSSVRLAKRAD